MSSDVATKPLYSVLLDGLVISLSVCGFVAMLGAMPETFFGQSASAVSGTSQPANRSVTASYQVAYPANQNITVNEARLTPYTIRLLSEDFGYTVQDGEYWYDSYSGAWGLKDGPIAGFIRPNLNIGGPLQEDASGVGTSVFLNGRELHQQDLHYLQSILGSIGPGRYWLDARGYFGYEGNPPSTNIIQIAHSTSLDSSELAANPYFSKEHTSIFFWIGKKYSFYDPDKGCKMNPGGGLSC